MSGIPGGIEPDQGPPMAIPLRHFLVGFGFLLVGLVMGVVGELGLGTGRPILAHIHLLLAGWVGLTIMGAMTQFVPVWSGTAIHSRRLARAQLWLVGVGLTAFAAALTVGNYHAAPVAGTLLLLGFWTFVYNVGRTLLGVRPWDVTERHFAIALAFFLALSALGLSLAIGLTRPLFADLPVTQTTVRDAHLTVAVFGAVFTTIFGALSQLATMFTQSDRHGVDHHLQRFEEVAFPVGVVALATGRLFETLLLARVGGVLISLAVFAMGLVLARRLYETRVDWTPMLSRYVVVAAAMLLWAVLTVPAWLADPLAADSLYGAPGTSNLVILGIVGFVLWGTLYHVVPFIIWVHRYSDRLGLEAVPMIDDLYDARLARLDYLLLASGTAGFVAADLGLLPGATRTAGNLVGLGAIVFVLNMLLVVRRHSPHGLAGTLWQRLGRRDPVPGVAD